MERIGGLKGKATSIVWIYRMLIPSRSVYQEMASLCLSI
jgi:hypothetical protein